jgi:putative transposase
MPRKPRIEVPDAIYHVMSRANGKGVIFETGVDRQDFLKTLAQTCAKTGWQVHAFCLMRHHFHLVVETPNAKLVAGMKWFLSAYTPAGQERSGQAGAGGALAPGNDTVAALDCASAAPGNLEEAQRQTAPLEKSQ